MSTQAQMAINKNSRIYQNSIGAQAGMIYPSEVKDVEPVKKLGWFDRWFLRKSQQAWRNAGYANEHTESSVTASYPSLFDKRGPVGPSSRAINSHSSMEFSVVRADGGWIVQFNTYDHKKDHNIFHHHLITEEQDFGQRMAEIITLECLRN